MENTIFGAISSVWTAIMTWIADSFSTIEGLFWTGSQLTFIGNLMVIAVGIGVFFLLMGIIQRFLHLRS